MRIWVKTVFKLTCRKTDIARSARGPKSQESRAEDVLAESYLVLKILREVKSWITVVMNRSHALGSIAAEATSDHTVIMSCLQGCRITLRLALRSVQTGVLIEILLDLSATVLWRLETHSASNSALRPRRIQIRWGTLSASCASGDFRALGRDSVLARQCPI